MTYIEMSFESLTGVIYQHPDRLDFPAVFDLILFFGGMVQRLILILIVGLYTTLARADETCGAGASAASTNDIASNTIIQPINGECFTGYAPININYEFLSPISNITNARCGVGYYPTSTGCVAYGRDNCPERYYAVAPINAFSRADSENTCSTNYDLYGDMEICKSWPSYPDKPNLCTPQLICNSGGTSLRTSTGIKLPIYRERLTTPSLNFGFENGGVCYLNLVLGDADGTINIRYNNQTYHGVE